jgi:hypothetical protein
MDLPGGIHLAKLNSCRSSAESETEVEAYGSVPNAKLSAARKSRRSPSGSGRALSRQELADACNAALSTAGLGRWGGMTAAYIGMLERGEIRWPNADYRRALTTVLQATATELGLYIDRPERTPRVKLRLRADSLTSRFGLPLPLPAAESERFATGWPAGMPDGPGFGTDSFVTVTQILASQRQAMAPAALLSLVDAHRASLTALFERAGTDPVRTDIGVMLGETSIVASRLWSALGNRGLATAYCAHTRQIADRLADGSTREAQAAAIALGATARIFESNLRSDAGSLLGGTGDLALGLRMLQEADAARDYLPPAARARTAAEQAQTYAVLQLPTECKRALDTAAAAVAEIDGTGSGLFSDWSATRLRVYEGTCWLFLGDAKLAVQALSEATTAMRNDLTNINVLLAAEVDLASAHTANGDLDEGCRLLGDTYTSLTRIDNRRGIERAHGARRRLRPWQGTRQIRELDNRMNAA